MPRRDIERGSWGLAAALSLTLALVISTITPTSTQGGLSTTNIYEAFNFETLAVSTTAVGLTASVYNPTGVIGARKVLCTVVADAVRYRFDGGTPTSSVGHLVAVGATFELYGSGNIRQLRLIRVTTDATAGCTVAR